jgi:PelA/Pel-15E family pectate lyase
MSHINIMELYNDAKKYSHPNLNNELGCDITCMFQIKIYKEIKNNFKLIDKGEKGELFAILNKERRIIFYYGNKIKRQIESPVLETNKSYNVVFTRSLDNDKNFIYIDGIICNVQPITNQSGLVKTSNEIKFMFGDSDYKMSKIRLYNYVMTPKQLKLNYLLDTKNKVGILKYISNRLDEILEISNGIYHGFLLDDILILFVKCQIYFSQKDYPIDSYVKYNMEQYDHDIPQILSMSILKTMEPNEKFNIDNFASNLVTWQVGMYEDTYPKNIESTVNGYWIEKEISPFIPYTGKGLNIVTSSGQMAEKKGTFQSGMYVSFIKLIINNFIKNQDSDDLLKSIRNVIKYIIDIHSEYEKGGVPLYYPVLDKEYWKYNISMKNGNYINFLRTIEIILNSTELLPHIESKIDKLKSIHKKTLNLLLKFQINVGKTKTIWCQYYDKKTFLPTDGNLSEPLGLCTLESAQILLYLMELENPTNNIKDAIISGCKWFKNNKVIGWMQIYDKKTFDPSDVESNFEQQTMLFPYNYFPFPDKMAMHSRYYDFNQKPIFKENDKYYTLDSFNNMSVEARNSMYHIGMWGHHLLEIFEEWKKIHNIPK